MHCYQVIVKDYYQRLLTSHVQKLRRRDSFFKFKIKLDFTKNASSATKIKINFFELRGNDHGPGILCLLVLELLPNLLAVNASPFPLPESASICDIYKYTYSNQPSK